MAPPLKWGPGGAATSVAAKRYRFTVDEYHRMGQAGILGEDVELIGGTLVVREPVGSRHAGTVNRLSYLWFSRVGTRAVVQAQNPVEFPEQRSEPQPDIAVLRPRGDFYAAAHPRAEDVLLVIEVADSALRLDRRVKIPLYARAGIPEAWLVDLAADRVHVYRAPSAAGYREVVTLHRGARLAPLAFADVSLTVDDLLG
jgi:Uma2 family endonuclease